MKEYHKIQTVFKRNPETKFKTLIEGDFSLPEFGFLKNNQWVFTEKVDGTNIRVMFADDGDGIEFRGKTDRAQLPPKLLKRLTEKFTHQLPVFESDFSDGVCLYGEGYGAKIQKGGGNYRLDQDFVLFDVKIGDWWLQRKDVECIAKQMGIDVVPIIGTGTLSDMIAHTRNGFNSFWGDFLAEGIVARPAIELKSRNGGRIITKIKHKDFRA